MTQTDAIAPARIERRSVDGILLLDKPAGMTSNRALQRVKGLFRARKAGHTGSLDPLATGMLPVCLGSATRISSFLLDACKEYQVRVLLGTATDTADSDGEVTAVRDAPAADYERIDAVLQSFVGASEQVPPMYSALKHEGRRLYELARAGRQVERKPRRIRIDWIRLLAVEWPHIEFSVRCSKGTYVRSLAVDLATRLDTVGHVTALRRLVVDPFAGAPLVSEDRVREAAAGGDAALDGLLLPADRALPQLPGLTVDAAGQDALVHGRTVAVEPCWAAGTLLRAYGPDGAFIGIGEADGAGTVRPRRIFLA